MFGEPARPFRYIKEKMNPRILEINKNIQSYKIGNCKSLIIKK